MTFSLCFSCARVKYGGIFVPCRWCGGRNTGDWGLDLLFSDHRLSLSTLEGFGSVLRSIRRTVQDPDVRLWVFLYYVSRHHPSLLTVELPSSLEERFATALERADPPTVTLKEREPSS